MNCCMNNINAFCITMPCIIFFILILIFGIFVCLIVNIICRCVIIVKKYKYEENIRNSYLNEKVCKDVENEIKQIKENIKSVQEDIKTLNENYNKGR